MKDALGPGINFQPLFLDPEVGVWSVIATFPPGVRSPIHLHTGPVHGYTLKGSWIYREYPDQPQTAGSYLYEPASSVHELYVPDTNTEDTVILFIVYGANVGFTEDGQFHSVLDAVTVQKLVEQCCAGSGPRHRQLSDRRHGEIHHRVDQHSLHGTPVAVSTARCR